MRKALLAAVIVMLCPAAFAGEVVLEKQANSSGRPMAYFKTDKLKYDRISAPDSAKAPDGDLEWGRLTVGKRSYNVCLTKERNMFTKLYLDADADNDFAEETPAKLRGSFITIEGMPVEFEVAGGTLIDKTNIFILQYTPRNGYVGISTKYSGSAEVEGKKVRIDWTPGQQPQLYPEGWRQGFSAYYFGKKKLTLKGGGVTLKDGKVAAECVLQEEEGLVEVPGGDLLKYVTLHQGRDGVACVAEEGKAYMPKGKYSVAYGYFGKKVGDDVYDMRVLLGSRNFEVKEGFKPGEFEPLKLSATISQRANRISFRANLTSASGGSVALAKNKKALSPPKLVIKDSEGNEIATHTFKPG